MGEARGREEAGGAGRAERLECSAHGRAPLLQVPQLWCENRGMHVQPCREWSHERGTGAWTVNGEHQRWMGAQSGGAFAPQLASLATSKRFSLTKSGVEMCARSMWALVQSATERLVRAAHPSCR